MIFPPNSNHKYVRLNKVLGKPFRIHAHTSDVTSTTYGAEALRLNVVRSLWLNSMWNWVGPFTEGSIHEKIFCIV